MKQAMLMSLMFLLISCSSLATNSKEFSKSKQTEKFITLVSQAKTYDLSHNWDENSPIASVNPKYSMALNATHADTRGTFGDSDQLSFTSEIM